MSTSKVEVYTSLFEANFKETSTHAGKVPEACRMRQLADGKGHPLWLLGHLAYSNHVIVHMWSCGGEPLIPREYNKIFAPDFAGGDPISSDPSAYPAWDEVLAEYEKVSEACLAGLRKLSDDDLNGELKGKVPDAGLPG